MDGRTDGRERRVMALGIKCWLAGWLAGHGTTGRTTFLDEWNGFLYIFSFTLSLSLSLPILSLFLFRTSPCHLYPPPGPLFYSPLSSHPKPRRRSDIATDCLPSHPIHPSVSTRIPGMHETPALSPLFFISSPSLLFLPFQSLPSAPLVPVPLLLLLHRPDRLRRLAGWLAIPLSNISHRALSYRALSFRMLCLYYTASCRIISHHAVLH
ncbi:hypothetical protein BKA80DRAFT_276788 [Phyllosticta citrichinensis]